MEVLFDRRDWRNGARDKPNVKFEGIVYRSNGHTSDVSACWKFSFFFLTAIRAHTHARALERLKYWKLRGKKLSQEFRITSRPILTKIFFHFVLSKFSKIICVFVWRPCLRAKGEHARTKHSRVYVYTIRGEFQRRNCALNIFAFCKRRDVVCFKGGSNMRKLPTFLSRVYYRQTHSAQRWWIVGGNLRFDVVY